jgi:hypothetical protein
LLYFFEKINKERKKKKKKKLQKNCPCLKIENKKTQNRTLF